MYDDQKVHDLLFLHIGLGRDDELDTETVEEHLHEFTRTSNRLVAANRVLKNMAKPNPNYRWWKPWTSKWAIAAGPLRKDAERWSNRIDEIS